MLPKVIDYPNRLFQTTRALELEKAFGVVSEKGVIFSDKLVSWSE